jgi:hypothetical protein
VYRHEQKSTAKRRDIPPHKTLLIPTPLLIFPLLSHPLFPSSRHIRSKLPRNIPLRTELTIQPIRPACITALVRRPRAPDLLAALPHQLRVVVSGSRVVDVIFGHFAVPPVDTGLRLDGEVRGVGFGRDPEVVDVLAICVIYL